jgi:hypothetical protein
MFTLEESALLGRMLRVIAWVIVCTVVGVSGYVVFRVETRASASSHPIAIPQNHHHS